MYSDNSLLPRETVRLAALGALTMGEMRYGALAGDVRHFISRLAGPSLELMGSSIELLRHEGLVEPVGDGDDPSLTSGIRTRVRGSEDGDRPLPVSQRRSARRRPRRDRRSSS